MEKLMKEPKFLDLVKEISNEKTCNKVFNPKDRSFLPENFTKNCNVLFYKQKCDLSIKILNLIGRSKKIKENFRYIDIDDFPLQLPENFKETPSILFDDKVYVGEEAIKLIEDQIKKINAKEISNEELITKSINSLNALNEHRIKELNKDEDEDEDDEGPPPLGLLYKDQLLEKLNTPDMNKVNKRFEEIKDFLLLRYRNYSQVEIKENKINKIVKDIYSNILYNSNYIYFIDQRSIKIDIKDGNYIYYIYDSRDHRDEKFTVKEQSKLLDLLLNEFNHVNYIQCGNVYLYALFLSI